MSYNYDQVLNVSLKDWGIQNECRDYWVREIRSRKNSYEF